MKGLPPALKEKKRYIAMKFIADREISKEELYEKLKEYLLELYGEFGYANFRIIQFKDNKGIISVKLRDLEKTKNAITLISDVNGTKVVPIILGVSGTIRSCRKKYLGGD